MLEPLAPEADALVRAHATEVREGLDAPVGGVAAIITRGQGDAFLHRIRLLLSSHRSLQSRFVFVISRSRFLQVHRQTMAGGSGSERLVPQYALQATFYADTHVAPKLRSDYYLCTFYLTHIDSGRIIWQGSYEMQKVVHSSFLY